ncbi:hypothetical protein VPH35_032741 [Triticum aestivum]|uniref:Uncharacterized protein n=1 Tax=Triticum turgidum subsp. durum TaxID=4567 RepID=A0A9R1RUW9_TRITD|nr:unnamed protein product [Triticum turgidum subsp. durum]
MSSTGVERSGDGAPRSRNAKRQQRGSGDELDAFSEELRQRPEVSSINKIAVVMAYILMGLKGVSALALLWATVVLLGGFVSDLTKTDFWYLTIIGFVQAAGLSDAMGDARMVSFRVWISSIFYDIIRTERKHHDVRTQLPREQRRTREASTIVDLILESTIVDRILFGIFIPVVYLALSGPFLCAMLSVLRLAKQDYGIADGDTSKANLKPALNLFYCVSLAQGTMFLSCTVLGAVINRKALSSIAQNHGLSPTVLRAYSRKTSEMCQNNPESRVSWNLITYGADLLDSQCPEDYASGGRALVMLIDQSTPLQIRRLLMRSPRQRIQKLIRTLAWRSPQDQEMRWLAARLVEHLAADLNLAHFPGALECVSSLFDEDTLLLTFVPGQRENGEEIDRDLVLPGLRILENLAHDRHNCTLIYNTKDLLSKIVAPISSNELIEDIKSSTAWTKVLHMSLKVVSRLMGSTGTTGEEMRNLIANDSNAVSNLEAILDMDTKSGSGVIELHVQAIEVLTQLALHHPTSSATRGRERLIKQALHIFVTADWMRDYLEDEKKKIDQPTQRSMLAQGKKKMKEAQETASRLKEKAGEALAMLSCDSEAIKSFTACKDDEVCRLTELLDSNIKTIKCKISATDTMEIEIKIGCRISATVILKHLSNYIKAPTLRKVLTELLPVKQAEARGTHRIRCWERVTHYNSGSRSDIENPSDGGEGKPSALRSRNQQCDGRRLQAELLSLITKIRASNNLNFTEILLSQTPPNTLEDFVVMLKKMVEDNIYATPTCLAIQKLTCEMVEEFLQDDGNVEVIDKHDIIGTLLKASKTMDRLESSMHFTGVCHDCHGVPLKPLSSVLAKRAGDLLTRRKRTLGINIAPAGVPLP